MVNVQARRRVVIVGAGIGGLATAMRLAATGEFDVTIYEKNEIVGGRCGKQVVDGYTFDTGPSLLLMTDVYRDLFAACGADFDSLVPLVKMEPNYGVHFADGTRLEMSSDLSTMLENLEAFEPRVRPQYLQFLEDSGRKYQIGRNKFVEKDFRKASDFFTGENLSHLLELNALDKLYSHVSKYFKDDRLRQAFSMQSMYLGISPYEAPAVYTLLAYTELVDDGLYFPKGGMYSLPTAMLSVAQKLGVRIETRSEISRIKTVSGRVTGLNVNGHDVETDIVISNADLPYTYTDLLESRPEKYEEAAWKKQKFTSSAFVLYLGLKKQYPQLIHHNFFLSKDYKKNFDEIFHAKVAPTDPSFYINVPNRTDPSLAPDGCDSIFVLVPIPHLTDQMTWSDSEIERFKRRIYNKLENLGLDGLQDNIAVEQVVTPHEWKSQYNLKYGAAFGLSHGILQVGYFRPQNKAPHVEGLYFVGASTVPGTGVPLVCLGAKLVVDRLLDDLRKQTVRGNRVCQ